MFSHFQHLHLIVVVNRLGTLDFETAIVRGSSRGLSPD
jgi:hypothetical protein